MQKNSQTPSSSIPITQIGLPTNDDDSFPKPQSINKQQPHYQKPRKVGRPQQQYLHIVESLPMPQNSQMRQISPEQLAMHRTATDAWLSLNGIVYDVTLYMDYHPGGLELVKGCGQECAHLFNQYHPWVNAQYLLQKFKVGYLNRQIGK